MIAAISMGFASGATAGKLDVEFDAADFPAKPGINPITNQYWPMAPGTSFVYAAETEDGCEVNMVTITNGYKDDFGAPYHTIKGLEVEDLEWFAEECNDDFEGDYILMEETIDRYAQDNDGNIWYLGETTEAYDDEELCLTEEGAWQAGDDDAEAGIVMLGNPIEGLGYQQEYLEDEAEDMGKVLELGVTVELEYLESTFVDCLKTKEWTPLERGHIEHKFYCPAAGGLMLINEKHGKTVRVEYIGFELPAGDFPEELPEVGVCEEEED
jgi:hypothetical protein